MCLLGGYLCCLIVHHSWMHFFTTMSMLVSGAQMVLRLSRLMLSTSMHKNLILLGPCIDLNPHENFKVWILKVGCHTPNWRVLMLSFYQSSNDGVEMGMEKWSLRKWLVVVMYMHFHTVLSASQIFDAHTPFLEL